MPLLLCESFCLESKNTKTNIFCNHFSAFLQIRQQFNVIKLLSNKEVKMNCIWWLIWKKLDIFSKMQQAENKIKKLPHSNFPIKYQLCTSFLSLKLQKPLQHKKHFFFSVLAHFFFFLCKKNIHKNVQLEWKQSSCIAATAGYAKIIANCHATFLQRNVFEKDQN